MKIRLVGAELLHARRADGHDDANNRFSQYLRTRLQIVYYSLELQFLNQFMLN